MPGTSAKASRIGCAVGVGVTSCISGGGCRHCQGRCHIGRFRIPRSGLLSRVSRSIARMSTSIRDRLVAFAFYHTVSAATEIRTQTHITWSTSPQLCILAAHPRLISLCWHERKVPAALEGRPGQVTVSGLRKRSEPNSLGCSQSRGPSGGLVRKMNERSKQQFNRLPRAL